MPHAQFKLDAFKNNESEEKALDSSQIYNTDALYFIREGREDINAQLKAFQESDSFPAFKQQYQDLLNGLKLWAGKQGVAVAVEEEEGELISVFDLYQRRLFHEYDFYSSQKYKLFSQGKKVLEEIFLLLQEDAIPVEIRKKNVLALKDALLVCSEGLYGKLVDVRDDLKAAYAGTHYLCANALRVLIQQFALEYSRLVHLNSEHYQNNEAHYINAYSNYVAEAFGLATKQDELINSLHLELEKLQRFAQDANKAITPSALLGELHRVLTEELQLIREQFFSTFFKRQEKILLEHTQNMAKEATRLIDLWNKKYGHLLPLDVNALMQLDKKGKHVIAAPYEEALYRQELSRNFNHLYLQEGHYEHSYRFFSKANLVVSNGLYWLEEQNEVRSASPKKLMQKKNHYVYGSFLLNELSCALPEEAHKLLQQHDGLALAPNPAQLLQRGFYASLATALSDEKLVKFLKPEDFQTREFAQVMNDFLTLNQGYVLFEKLLARHWLTQEMVFSLWDTIIAVKPKLADVLKKLLDERLLTAQLMAKESSRTVAHFLIHAKKFALLKRLLQADLLTTELLAVEDEGVNVVWLLADRGQFNLLELMLQKNLLNSKLLAVHAASNPKQTNVLWFLIEGRKKELVADFVRAKMITTDLLQHTPEGKSSALQLMFEKGDYPLLGLLLQEGILDKNSLAEHLQPVSLDWLLLAKQIKEERFDLVDVLLDKNILAWKSQFSFFPTESTTSLPDGILFLHSKGQTHLLEKCIAKGIVSRMALENAVAKKLERGGFFSEEPQSTAQNLLQSPQKSN